VSGNVVWIATENGCGVLSGISIERLRATSGSVPCCYRGPLWGFYLCSYFVSDCWADHAESRGSGREGDRCLAESSGVRRQATRIGLVWNRVGHHALCVVLMGAL
jgi:hypothetical protein